MFVYLLIHISQIFYDFSLDTENKEYKLTCMYLLYMIIYLIRHTNKNPTFSCVYFGPRFLFKPRHIVYTTKKYLWFLEEHFF